jgi:Uri superfamily endonuclease
VKGSYILLIGLSEKQTITIGSLKTVNFSGGYYAYVGSAMGGIKSRLSHHLKGSKKPHWQGLHQWSNHLPEPKQGGMRYCSGFKPPI